MGNKVDQETREKYIIPAFCPLCNCIMKGDRSNKSYFRFGCCDNCFTEFVEDREDRWKSGWRPSKEQIEAYIVKYYS